MEHIDLGLGAGYWDSRRARRELEDVEGAPTTGPQVENRKENVETRENEENEQEEIVEKKDQEAIDAEDEEEAPRVVPRMMLRKLLMV